MSSHAAQPLALTRWRRGHIHFSPAARPLLQAGSPEWSVASDAEGGSGERGEPSEFHLIKERPHARSDILTATVPYTGGVAKVLELTSETLSLRRLGIRDFIRETRLQAVQPSSTNISYSDAGPISVQMCSMTRCAYPFS